MLVSAQLSVESPQLIACCDMSHSRPCRVAVDACVFVRPTSHHDDDDDIRK